MRIQRAGERVQYIGLGDAVQYRAPRAAAGAGNGLLNALIAYYKLDEAGGANDALDAHTGGLTFTQVNAPGSDAGKIGTARTFAAASAQYFSRADDSNFSTGDVDFTISAWVYLANVTANHGIFGKWGGFGSREYGLFYNDTDHVPNDRFSFLVSSAGGLM